MGWENKKGSYKNTGNKARPRKTRLLLIKIGEHMIEEEHKVAFILNFLLSWPLQVRSTLDILFTVLKGSLRV